MRFNCLKASATSRRQFTFYHLVPRYSWYSFYRPRKDERLSRPWSHPVVLNNVLSLINSNFPNCVYTSLRTWNDILREIEIVIPSIFLLHLHLKNYFPALFFIIWGSTAEHNFTTTIHLAFAFAWLPIGLVENYHVKFHLTEIVCNTVKGQVLKWVFQENKAHQIFCRTKIP